MGSCICLLYCGFAFLYANAQLQKWLRNEVFFLESNHGRPFRDSGIPHLYTHRNGHSKFLAEMVTSLIELQKEMLNNTEKNVAEFQYTSCYCEENIYHLCKTLREHSLAANDFSDLFVVFISNPIQQIPLWRQRKSTHGDGLCVWDYHVICIQKSWNSEECKVWDLDTTLPLPVSLSKYVSGALRPDIPVNRKYHRLFRVVKTSLFLRFFASDRRHMKNGEGMWLASPPSYNCIVAEDGEVHNLDKYNIIEPHMSLTKDVALDKLEVDKFGVVLSEDGMLKLFGCLMSLTAPVEGINTST